jgi:hypothetical protein
MPATFVPLKVTGWVLAVAFELDLVRGLAAVLAAIFAVSSVFGNAALTGRVGALGSV